MLNEMILTTILCLSTVEAMALFFGEMQLLQNNYYSLSNVVPGQQRLDFWPCSSGLKQPGSTLKDLTAPEGGRLLRPREELCPSRAMRHRF